MRNKLKGDVIIMNVLVWASRENNPDPGDVKVVYIFVLVE